MLVRNRAAAILFVCALALPAMARASSFTSLHDFAGGADGSYPSAALTPAVEIAP
jgi:hypothetical protein